MIEQKKDWLMPTALGAGILLVIGAAGFYLMRDDAPAPEAVVETTPPVAETPAPPPRAVETPPPARTLPLPPLDQSDTEVLGGLTELFGQDAVMRHLVPERLVRNIVVTIDNIPREKMALNQRPVQPTPGDFITTGEESAVKLGPANYERYEPFVALVSNTDAKTLVSFYRGLEPLFQEAYEDLGHPNQSFNARLNEVIEHLLQTPTPRGEIALVQPGVLYKYSDERLEKLSAGQKLLIRMGVNNATVIKGKLREIQAELL